MNQVNVQAKNFITSLSISAWVFVAGVALTPILVGIIEIISTDWTNPDRLLGALAPSSNAWLDVIGLSVIFAIVLGIMSWYILFIQTRVGFQTWPAWIQIVTTGALVLLTIVFLWSGITWIYLITFFSSHDGPLLGWPVTPSWIVTIGWFWTGIITVFVTIYHSRQHLEKQKEI
jgi:uncharacterized membrane protein (DUF485 family)